MRNAKRGVGHVGLVGILGVVGLALAACDRSACEAPPAGPPANAPTEPKAVQAAASKPIEVAGRVNEEIPAADREVLERGETFELLALDPTPLSMQGKPVDSGFHGYAELGRAAIAGEERRALLVALYGGVAHPSPAAACFNPRHALHAVGGGRTVDLVICFECDTIWKHVGEGKSVVHVSPAPEPTFDATLRAHGLHKHGTEAGAK